MSTDPLQPHRHDNNPTPPATDSTVTVTLPDGARHLCTVADLIALPQTELPAYTISTDHGDHGPYRLGGVALLDLVNALVSAETPWSNVELISADGFGNRVFADELHTPSSHGPILLALTSNGAPLSRAHGLVRLIVPSERDNALRQIKWLQQIRIRP